MQWFGMFWLDFGCCFHSAWWNVSWSACELHVKEQKKHVLTLKLYKKLYASLSYPGKSQPQLSRLSQRTQTTTLINISPKFMVYVILCAQPLDSMTSFAKKLWYDWHEIHTLNAVTGVRYLNANWCKIHTLMQQSDWCKIHTQMQQCDWCLQHTTLYTNIELFFFIKWK